ncbi:hypothetical protein [Microbacterium sp. zg-YB36]|uniref:hypothetical protein n=1 Tax=Microbacterium sp. zg-YB36 TaxID=2969407 RepID=UPI00214AC45D|nr:hypothetical protein [Microbacterium sp. zg-YB36]MDL5351184.1 hypothetical protein [Microbacterium sp. zg-YB36]
MSRTMMRRTLTINGTLDDLAGVLRDATEDYGIPADATLVQADLDVTSDTTFGNHEAVYSALHVVFEWPADETKGGK